MKLLHILKILKAKIMIVIIAILNIFTKKEEDDEVEY